MEIFLSWSHEPTTFPSPMGDESNPRYVIYFRNIYFNIILPS